MRRSAETPPRPVSPVSRRVPRGVKHALHALREDLFRVPVRTMPPMSRPRFLRRLPHTLFVLLALVRKVAG